MRQVSWKLGSIRRHTGVLVALILVLIIHLIGATFISVLPVETLELKDSKPPKPFIVYSALAPGAATDPYSEQAMLLDTKPLFLPTKRNFRYNPLEVRLQTTPAPLVKPYGPMLTLNEAGIIGNGSEGDLDLRTPVDFLKREYFGLFNQLGYRSEPTSLRNTPVAIISAHSLSTGEQVLVHQLNGDGTILNKDLLWRPVAYSIEISPELGLLQPIKLKTSGHEQIDVTLDQYIMNSETIRSLPTGYYRIDIQPN